MSLRKILFFFILTLSLTLFFGCSDDDDDGDNNGGTTVDELTMLTEAGDVYFTDYKTAATNQPVNVTLGGVGDGGIYDILMDDDPDNDPYIIDWRSAEVFEAGHLKGKHTEAVNMSIGNLASEIDNLPHKMILNVCYTGQTASHATAIMNLVGMDPDYAGLEAQNLKFGMCSVGVDDGTGNVVPYISNWTDRISEDEFTDWETTENTTSETYDFPTIDTGKEGLADIIKDRYNAYMSDIGGGWAIKGDFADFYANRDDYFIVNYWPEDRYLDPGHIAGAYVFPPNSSLEKDGMLNLLPTGQDIMIYCYTGQTSAQVSAYLRLLGYDAWSLGYGVNGFAHQEMVDRGWPNYHAPTFDHSAIMEMEEPEETEFDILAAAGEAYFTNYVTPATSQPVNVVLGGVGDGGYYDILLDADPDNDPYIIDWRRADDYEAGHLKGVHTEAVNMSLADLTSEIDNLPRDRMILNVCYTGQTASHATAFMNIVGMDPAYSGLEAQNLKFGMSYVGIWSDEADDVVPYIPNWENKIEDQDPFDWETTENVTATTYDFPMLSTGETSIAEIAKARFDAYLAELGSGWAIKGNFLDFYANRDDYFIANYWPEDRYLDPGHIAGAFNFPPGTLIRSDRLNLLPKDASVYSEGIVVYCYTGQTSAQMAAFLRMLGYPAWSLGYGANGFDHAEMDARGWAAYHPPTVDHSAVIYQPVTEFDMLAEAGENYFTNYQTPATGQPINVVLGGVGDGGYYDILLDADPDNDPYIIDWRQAADYEAGHLKGVHTEAVNMSLADLTSEIDNLPRDRMILNVCYTGQTASHATAVINLIGMDPAYEGLEAQNLKFGMSYVGIWSDDEDDVVPYIPNWANKIEDQDSFDWETTANTTSTIHDYPEINTGHTSLADIIKARFDAYLDELGGGWAIKGNFLDYYANRDDYFTANYWPEDRYLDPGHIAGAYNFPPGSLTRADHLNLLPSDTGDYPEGVVVYCYTGQTSAQMAAFLRILGYPAWSLGYGANGFDHAEMDARGWAAYHAPTFDHSAVLWMPAVN